jgi:integrase
MAAADPIRDLKQLRQLAGYWLKRGGYRNYALIVLGAHTALRIWDLLHLKWNDVYDAKSGKFRSHINLTEKKTGKRQTIALNPKAAEALRLYLPHGRGAYIFVGSHRDEKPISRVQAWRIIRIAADAVRAAGRIACHSLRKTFGYFAWKMGALPVMLTDIFNHSSYEVTRRYLGITQDDRDGVYLKMALF